VTQAPALCDEVVLSTAIASPSTKLGTLAGSAASQLPSLSVPTALSLFRCHPFFIFSFCLGLLLKELTNRTFFRRLTRSPSFFIDYCFVNRRPPEFFPSTYSEVLAMVYAKEGRFFRFFFPSPWQPLLMIKAPFLSRAFLNSWVCVTVFFRRVYPSLSRRGAFRLRTAGVPTEAP